MPISSLTAARIVCERSGWTISNLKLQKILYLAQMAYMGDHNGQPLIDGRFKAWDYGPVLPDVYEIVARFGRNPIKDAFGPVGETDEKEKKALEFFLIHYCSLALQNLWGSRIGKVGLGRRTMRLAKKML